MNCPGDLFKFMVVISGILTQNAAQQPQPPQLQHEQFGYQQPPLPPFLLNASEAARREFFNIAYNSSAKIAEINAELEEWAKQQPKNVQDAYYQQLNMQKQMESILSEERQKLVNALPADAKEVAMKLDVIRENLQLTPSQQMRQVMEILQKTSPSVRQQLNNVDQQLGQMLQQQLQKH